MTTPLTKTTSPHTAKAVLVVLELVGCLAAGLSLQALVRVAFDRDVEPLWGLFRGVSASLTGQVVLTVVLGLVGAALGAFGHLRQRRSAPSRP